LLRPSPCELDEPLFDDPLIPPEFCEELEDEPLMPLFWSSFCDAEPDFCESVRFEFDVPLFWSPIQTSYPVFERELPADAVSQTTRARPRAFAQVHNKCPTVRAVFLWS
jgi:hypothetical protein